jgi:hypothetical protein
MTGRPLQHLVRPDLSPTTLSARRDLLAEPATTSAAGCQPHMHPAGATAGRITGGEASDRPDFHWLAADRAAFFGFRHRCAL